LGVNVPCDVLGAEPVPGVAVEDPLLGLAVVAALAMMELPLETTAPITPPASIEPASSEPTTAVRSRGIVTS
jgi:hypothetical protein